MRRLVVINSFGPMASTLLAGLIEKLGYSNVPIRKLRLHDYLMGNLSLDSGVIQQRLKAILEAHSKMASGGGVSVLGRYNQKPQALVDINKVRDQLEAFEAAKYDSIQDLYFDCHRIYNDAVIYKDMKHNEGWHTELTVDFNRFDTRELSRKYEDHFDDIRMVHLHRDFRGWINALSSQAMFHPALKNRLTFFPHRRYQDYMLYEKSVTGIPGLHMDFREFFSVPIEEQAARLGTFLDALIPDIDLRAEEYDMYGKIQPYEVAFKPFDDNVSFLRKPTLDYMEKAVETGSMSKFPANVISWLKYLQDSRIYLNSHAKSGDKG